jgi:hypothetical protein
VKGAAVVCGNRRQHTAGYSPVEGFGDLEADRPQTRHRHLQRRFRTSRDALAFGLRKIFHIVNFTCIERFPRRGARGDSIALTRSALWRVTGTS